MTTLSDRTEIFLTSHLGDFIAVSGLLLLLGMLARIIISFRFIISTVATKKRDAWYNVYSVGLDLCLIAIGGVYTASKVRKSSDISANDQTILLDWLLAVIILLLASSLISAASKREKSPFLLNTDCFLGIHIPNAIGIVAMFLAGILIMGGK